MNGPKTGMLSTATLIQQDELNVASARVFFLKKMLKQLTQKVGEMHFICFTVTIDARAGTDRVLITNH